MTESAVLSCRFNVVECLLLRPPSKGIPRSREEKQAIYPLQGQIKLFDPMTVHVLVGYWSRRNIIMTVPDTRQVPSPLIRKRYDDLKTHFYFHCCAGSKNCREKE